MSSRGAESPLEDGDALRVVLVNCPPDRAEAIARAALEARLAACVNILPEVRSLYWWKGKIERDVESTLLLKTRASLVAELTRVVRANHPYEVPEVIALEIRGDEGNAEYLAWLLAETTR